MEITKREILSSIAIICILLTLGLFISGGIAANLNNKYQEYNTALQIADSSELFGYAMRTNVGNAFVHGALVAVDPVSIVDIAGEYSEIERVEERYTRHTRIVTYTDSEGNTHTREEVYWTWDEVDRDEWHCNVIAFLGYEFPYGTINFPRTAYHSTNNFAYHRRYVYYVSNTEYAGTIYTRINNHTINKTVFYNNYSIEDCIKHLESGWELYLFWAFWIFLIIGATIGYYYLDNKWLE